MYAPAPGAGRTMSPEPRGSSMSPGSLSPVRGQLQPFLGETSPGWGDRSVRRRAARAGSPGSPGQPVLRGQSSGRAWPRQACREGLPTAPPCPPGPVHPDRAVTELCRTTTLSAGLHLAPPVMCLMSFVPAFLSWSLVEVTTHRDPSCPLVMCVCSRSSQV